MKKINTICIIDDDPIFRFGTKKMMETVQFSLKFLVYKNGKDAFDNLLPQLRLNTNLPDVILLDLNMPLMDGWQFLDELAKIPFAKNIPIYIVSSSVDSRDIKKAKSYKMVNKYIVKPFSISKIQELMGELKNHA
ncbi:response regulator [Gelidibacter gilvus]|uniref:Response regulator n=1 Tax=Gelidibacter gilvus TaxID=59602 RepID=A0A4Q0XG82_9FLAO|nr:response regulator [Gelidibacter gilvus]RXJ50250.1 response regulator [Gelidibacter gilvus]